jgi:cytochrome b pre-mRNA-processing protein 3
MFQWLRDRAHTRRVAGVLYDAIVAQSRAEPFYRELGISDTLQGRFELIVLHMFLVLNRLQREGRAGRNIAQALIERFVTDMDDCMREIGIGDLAVPRRVKRAAAALYERAAAYGEAAQAAGNGQRLAAALDKHVYGEGCGDATRLARLADYVRTAMQVLAGQPSSLLLQGVPTFPDVRQAAL